jgi:hypothetical protein
MCPLSSAVMPALFLGVIVATLTGLPAVGWVVGALAGAIVLAVQRRRRGSLSCAVPPRPGG